MSGAAIDPQWLAHLHTTADQLPARQRVPLLWQQHQIGTVEPDYLTQIVPQLQAIAPGLLQRQELADGLRWCLGGELTQTLEYIAQALLAADVGCVKKHWRNEQLAVCNTQDQRLATVERGVVRPLGIATRAVHLVGCAPDGRFWVQQRAFNKANDPGQWDTLMGGMISAADTVETALERETWEEAGLRTTELVGLKQGGRITMRKPNRDDAGVGYVVEKVDWFIATVPHDTPPNNQDGEVEQFMLIAPQELVRRLQNNEFTTEAALILVAALNCYLPPRPALNGEIGSGA